MACANWSIRAAPADAPRGVSQVDQESDRPIGGRSTIKAVLQRWAEASINEARGGEMEEWRRKKIEQVYSKWEKRERHATHRADPSR